MRLAVGDEKPGTRPIRLEKRINRPNVAIRGKNFRPCGPIVSMSRPSNPRTIASMTFWKPPGTMLT